MKKGDKVDINEKNSYSGQDMAWTERITGNGVLSKNQFLYHFSDKKIKGFVPKETCFFLDKRSYGHCYILILEENLETEFYNSEVRIYLNEKMKIFYLGEIKYLGNGETKDYTISEKKLIL